MAFKCVSIAMLLCHTVDAFRAKEGVVNASGTPPVLFDGYDVMEYWGKDGGRAVKGTSALNLTILGKDQNGTERVHTMLFSTANNMQTFFAAPDQYMPQFGGFCAWGIARENPPQWPWSPTSMGPPGGVDAKNRGWAVHNGKLYISIWASVMNDFLANATANVALGEARWTGWFGATTEGRLNSACFAEGKRYCEDPPMPVAPYLL